MNQLTSLLDFVRVQGATADERYRPMTDYLADRRRQQTWPYRRILQSTVADQISASDETGRQRQHRCLNYASQDYLGLVQDPRINAAAVEAVGRYGVHSSGSPTLLGRSRPMIDLAERLCDVFNRSHCLLYPTGWAAGFGVITGLVRANDHVIMDKLAHNCLQIGAHAATNKVRRFRHNDLDHARRLLSLARAQAADAGVFLVIESVYSMDADSPDLPAMIALAREYEAIVILDVAHDFGAMGARGLGLLEQVDASAVPDVIMGSFSKTFASNGGFVLSSSSAHDYLSYHSPSHVFSNALSPVQASVALQAAEIVFSAEGDQLRRRLMDNVLALRAAFARWGIGTGGVPTPIVPAFVGDEQVARETSRYLTEAGLLANLVEFPAVARGGARFRFQVMPTHSADSAERAAAILHEAIQCATALPVV